MKDLNIKKELKLIAELLYSNGCNGTVYFDPASYDNELDIPSLLIDSDFVWISEFHINEEGDVICIVDNYNNSYSLDFSNLSQGMDDEYFIKIGFDSLLRDVYYETKESSEIGDYELNFILK